MDNDNFGNFATVGEQNMSARLDCELDKIYKMDTKEHVSVACVYSFYRSYLVRNLVVPTYFVYIH